jgi:protein-L-isoaspartate(D-aspartate) O-methyltransferase
VVSIERQPELVEVARRSLAAADAENVEIICADGARGWLEEAPYEAINVAAAVRDEVPAPLKQQLAEGGRMVVPVGRWRQWLELWRREDGELSREKIVPVAFVPLVEGEGDLAAG